MSRSCIHNLNFKQIRLRSLAHPLSCSKRVLRYLQATKTLALLFSSEQRDTQLVRFSDSDWGGDRDVRKSTSGYVFTIGGTVISWKSKKQAVVALSSTEAEYIGISGATWEAIWH